MARTKLTQLLGDSKPETAQSVGHASVSTEPEQAIAPVPEAAPATARPTRAVINQRAPIDAPDVGGGAHYLSFVRKETRLRGDQLDALAAKARQINRNKTDGGERITDNTLIRIAVDLLLARADKLAGSTEDQLRNSVSS